MKAIAKLKDDARKYEQKEEWEKAIHAYLEVLKLGEQGDGAELDLPLYNRVGDLYVRLGRQSDAVTYYEKAADRYAEAGLYNNAIALCNKALRYDANRLELLRKLGSFSASQGFFTDARRWYLEYAEKSIKRGNLDGAFKALADYAEVNDEAEIRELLARQLRDHARKEEAVEEFKRAYVLRMAAGQPEQAEAVRAELLALDPSADVSTAQESTHHHVHDTYEAEQLPGFDQYEPAPEPEPEAEAEPEPAVPQAVIEQPPVVEEPEPLPDVDVEQTGLAGGLDLDDIGEFETIDIESGFEGADEGAVAPLDIGLEPSLGEQLGEMPDTDDDFELPTLETEESEDATAVAFDEAALELPGFDDEYAEEDADEEPLPELPGFDDFAVAEAEPAEEEAEAEPLPTFEDFAAQAGAALDDLPSPALSEPEAHVEPPPAVDEEPEPAADQELVFDSEPTFEVEPTFEPEPPAFEPEPPAFEPEPPAFEPEPAFEPPPAYEPPSAYQPPPPAAPAAAAPAPEPAPPPARPKREYVDLASFLNDEEEEAEESTRFVVAEKPPTGDEEKDFADMLAQFKQKVAESIPTEDSGSHYDLGIAFKEMGLVDEAIGEFQTALRAGQEKLKVYEELGSCFVIKQQYSVAITVLNRAQTLAHTDDSELLGVFYNLGRAHEALGQRAEAKAAYEKILAIDISFRDTTERIAKL